MRTTFESDQAIIIDDFLPTTVLNNLREQVECLKLKQLEYGDDKIYKLDCGTIYKSDKKNNSSKINLILIKKIGKVILDLKFDHSKIKKFLVKELVN